MSENNKHSEEIELYGDPGIASYDAPIPKFLIWTYATLPFWGLFALYYYWNGSVNDTLDRKYWHELQVVSNTTNEARVNKTLVNQEEELKKGP